MKSSVQRRIARGALAALLTAGALAAPAVAHHSFSAYDMKKTLVFTGVVTRVNPDANHLQIFFAPMNEERKNVLRGADGKPVIWAVEMVGSAQAAQNGISVSTFGPGSIFSVTLHPERSGEHAGTRGRNSVMFRCPDKKPPPAGLHCDSVPGHVAYKSGAVPAPPE